MAAVTKAPMPIETNETVTEWAIDPARDAWAYWIDACQRGALFLDAIERYCDEHELAPAVAGGSSSRLVDQAVVTRDERSVSAGARAAFPLFREGKSAEEVAEPSAKVATAG